MAQTNSPEAVFVSFLDGDADVVTRFGTRIRPLRADQGDTMPFLAYERIGSDKTHHMTASSGLGFCTMRLRGFATTAIVLQQMREECRLALDGRRPGSVTIDGNALNVRSIRLTEDRDEFQDPTDDSDDGIYGFAQDYDLVHVEEIPSF